MTTLRLLRVFAFATILLVPASALAQGAPPAVSGAALTGGVAVTRDGTLANKFMPGVSAGVDVPIGTGQWVVIEGSYYWTAYPRIDGSVPLIKRAAVSVAARIGRPSGHGPFAQVGIGASTQTLSGVGGSREASKYWSGSDDDQSQMVWLAPGIGADITLTPRLAVRVMAEALILPQTPRDRWVASRFQSAIVYRLSRR
jgi:hypothetical protein